MSRSKSSPAISLFAFQDAITSVCGVVVLVTLMLALELTKRVELEATPDQESQEYAEKLQGEVDELNARLSQARETLQETARFDQETIGMTLEEVQRQYEQTEADLERAKLAREQTGERLQERSGLAEDFAARQKEIDKLQTELDALNAKTEKANQTASELRAKEGREVVFEYEGSAREKPWFVELAEKKIVVHSASGSPAPVSMRAEAKPAVCRHATGTDCQVQDRQKKSFSTTSPCPSAPPGRSQSIPPPSSEGSFGDFPVPRPRQQAS